jgi:hypothetical protein
MLNFGFWSSLKGMVKVPNLSGLTRTTASQSIVNSGLIPVETGSTTTADDTLNQKIASQTPALDTLVDYETNVSYTYYLFSFTPYSFTPTAPYSFTPYSFTPVYSFTPYSFTPVYSFTPYSFTPVYAFTPTASSGVWYTYCGNPSAGYDPGTVVGPIFEATKTCAQILQIITQSNDAVSGTWNCLPGTSAQPSVSAAVCTAPYSFTPTAPYSFTPYSFTPNPAIYSFTPVTPYSFTPQAPYSFTPQAPYSFTPKAPYSFTPVAPYSFVPLKVCIDQDTLVQVVGYNDSVEFKAAKDIKLGDHIWSITWEGLLDDLQDPSASTVYPENLQGVQRVKSQIVQIDPSIKDTTIYFNGDKNKRFTAEEKVLIKRLDSHMFVEAKTITKDDFIFEATDYGMIATPVTGIDYIEEIRNVFKFNAFPVDTIIAGNMVVHNSKV